MRFQLKICMLLRWLVSNSWAKARCSFSSLSNDSLCKMISVVVLSEKGCGGKRVYVTEWLQACCMLDSFKNPVPSPAPRFISRRLDNVWPKRRLASWQTNFTSTGTSQAECPIKNSALRLSLLPAQCLRRAALLFADCAPFQRALSILLG